MAGEEFPNDTGGVNVPGGNPGGHVGAGPTMTFVFDGIEDYGGVIPAVAPGFAGNLTFLEGNGGGWLAAVLTGPAGGPVVYRLQYGRVALIGQKVVGGTVEGYGRNWAVGPAIIEGWISA